MFCVYVDRNELTHDRVDEELIKLKRGYEEKDKEQIRNINNLQTACQKTQEQVIFYLFK